MQNAQELYLILVHYFFNFLCTIIVAYDIIYIVKQELLSLKGDFKNEKYGSYHGSNEKRNF